VLSRVLGIVSGGGTTQEVGHAEALHYQAGVRFLVASEAPLRKHDVETIEHLFASVKATTFRIGTD
jgi:hypothetical protein